jgi:cbb3-type cytochrome oxidase maturation protein
MYTPYFITYIVVGLALGLGAFAWALKSGQFKDQERARFLPLALAKAEAKAEAKADAGANNRADIDGPATPSTFGRLETYALLGMACIGLLISAFTLIYSLLAA